MAGIVSRRLLRWKLHLPGSLHHQLRIFDSLSHQLCLPVSTRRCLGGDRQSTSEADVESEWALDTDIDPAPQLDSEPHPLTEQPGTTPLVRGQRLRFNIGMRMMTAPQLVRRALLSNKRFTSASRETARENLEETEEEEEEERNGEEEEMEEVRGGEEVKVVGVASASGDSAEERVRRRGRKRSVLGLQDLRNLLKVKGAANGLGSHTHPATAALLQTLTRDLKPNAKTLGHFTTFPSILGTSAEETEKRVLQLKKLGFSRREMAVLLLAFPSIVEVDFANVRSVCVILKRCVAGGWVLRGLIQRYPFLFLQPPKQIEERLTVLKKLCTDTNMLGSLLHNFPLLLFTPLTTSTLHTITQAQAAGLCGDWVARSLYHNMSAYPARSVLGADVSNLIGLLKEFDVDPNHVLVRYPSYFSSTSHHISSLLDVLSGHPLYMESGRLRTILSCVPDQLAFVRDTESLRRHLSLLCSLFSSEKECTAKVLLSPGLILPQCDIQGWKEELGGFGFTDQQCTSLLSQTSSILLLQREEEFMPRLKFLLKIPHTSPSHIVACSAASRWSIFTSPLEVMAARLNYANKQKPDVISGQHLTGLFASTDQEFAKLCGRTLDQLSSETGLAGVMLRRFKSKRQSPKKAALEEAAKLLEAQATIPSETETQTQSKKTNQVKRGSKTKSQTEVQEGKEQLVSRSVEPPGEADVGGLIPNPAPDSARMTATKKEVIRKRGESVAAGVPAGRCSSVGTVRRGVQPRRSHGNSVSPATVPAALSHGEKTVA